MTLPSRYYGFWYCATQYLICVTILIQFVLSVNGAQQKSAGPKTFSIYWNISTDAFRIDNTDHIFDINKGNSKFEYDQVNIICPVYNSREVKDEETEKYMIYNVSKEEYDTCRITNPNPRVIAVCDKPFRRMYFTITFRPFSPQPGGLEFLPGHDYYFISTASKDDLHRRVSGRCLSHNMKVLFKVWHPIDEQPPTTTSTHAPPPPPIVVGTVPYPSWPYITSNVPHYPPNEDNEDDDEHFNIASTVRSTTKKVKPYEKHPNDVEKSSLTRSNSCSQNRRYHIGMLLTIILFTIISTSSILR